MVPQKPGQGRDWVLQTAKKLPGRFMEYLQAFLQAFQKPAGEPRRGSEGRITKKCGEVRRVLERLPDTARKCIRRVREYFRKISDERAEAAYEKRFRKAEEKKSAGRGKGPGFRIPRTKREWRRALRSLQRESRRKVPWLVPAAAVAAAGILAAGLFWTLRPDRAAQPAQLSGSFGPEKATAFSGRIPLAVTFRSLLEGAREGAVSARDQAEQSLRESYIKILEDGKGDSFSPASGRLQALWEETRVSRRETLQQDPFLLLVNKWHYLPEDYEADPVDLPNGQRIDAACYESLTQMLQDCAEAGGTPIVCSGYRPHWYQVNLFDAQISRWLYAGYGQEEAEELAATAVAIPGTSEHELGYAADIYSSENMDLDESQIYTFTQQWLMENCWRYGFILRYPADKSEITGIIFEPWHYRYVGTEHAKKIFDAGICLEEYLDQTEHP